MPVEKRDYRSKARLFVPTASERAVRSSQKKLDKELKEVGELKKEMEKLIKESKSN